VNLRLVRAVLPSEPMPENARRAAVVTVLNLKGGVGKTNTTWILASVAQEREQRILLVDLDTQANLTRSFLDSVDPQRSVAELFNPAAQPDILKLVHRTAYSHIDLIPSCPQLAPFDLSDQQIWEETDRHLALLEPIDQLRSTYDFIVFDCPPRLSLVNFAALCCCDFVIVPLEAADWGAQGVRQVTEAIHYVRDRFNPRLQLLGYVVSRYRRSRSYQRTYLAGLRKHFGQGTFDTVLNDLAQFERSATDRIPITLRAPKSQAAEVARKFVDEVCRRIADKSESGQRLGAEPEPAATTAAGK
jgi:chromosome partitioning protein